MKRTLLSQPQFLSRLLVVPALLMASFSVHPTARAQIWGSSTLNADTPWGASGWGSNLFAGTATATAAINSRATANASVAGGGVSGVSLVSGGSGYTVPPRVTFVGGGGTGASATCSISGGAVVAGSFVITPGTGYTSPPTVVISAQITVTVSPTTQGFGYDVNSVPPRVVVTGGNTPANGDIAATAVATVVGGKVTAVTIADQGSGYTGVPTITIDNPAPEGAGSFIHWNNDISATAGFSGRTITLDKDRTMGMLVVGDLSDVQTYTFASGTGTNKMIFDGGSPGGGNAYINKMSGGLDVINTTTTLKDQLNVRVMTSTLTLGGTLERVDFVSRDGSGGLPRYDDGIISYGNGVLAVTGNNTNSNVPIWLWNRGGGGTGAQVELGATVGNAIAGTIMNGNVSWGNSGHSVLQLKQDRTNMDQIADTAAVFFDGISGRNNYFKIMGGSETIGRLVDMGGSGGTGGLSVIENTEGETVNLDGRLVVGQGGGDSFVSGYIRDRSSTSGSVILFSNDTSGRMGISKVGNGKMILVGGNISYTGETVLSGGTLHLRDTVITSTGTSIPVSSTLTAIRSDGAGTNLILERTSASAWEVFNNIQGTANPAVTASVTVTSSNTTMTLPPSTIAALVPGMVVSGANIRPGTVVLSINPATNQVTLSSAPSAAVTSSSGALSFISTSNNPNVTIMGPGAITIKATVAPPTFQFAPVLTSRSIGSLTVIGGNPTAGGTSLTNNHFTLNGNNTISGGIFATTDAGFNVNLRLTGTNVLTNGMNLVGRFGQAGSRMVIDGGVITSTIGLSAPGGTNIVTTETHNEAGVLNMLGGSILLSNMELFLQSGVLADGSTPIANSGRITGNPTSITIAGRPSANSTVPAAAPLGAGRLVLDYTRDHSVDRLPDGMQIVSKGGALEFVVDMALTPGNVSETVGGLLLSEGDFQINTYRATSTRTSTLTFGGLNQIGLDHLPGATVEFLGKQQNNLSTEATTALTNSYLGANAQNKVIFTSGATLKNGILGGWAYVGTDFATYGGNGVQAFQQGNDTYSNNQTVWDATRNIKPTGSQTLTARRAVNSLNLINNFGLSLGGNILSIESGGLMVTGTNGTSTVQGSGGGLTVGSASAQGVELYSHVDINKVLTVSGVSIQNFQAVVRVSTTSSTATIALPLGAVAGLLPGMTVTGVNIPPNTTILTVNAGGNTITLSNMPSAPVTPTSGDLTITGGSVSLVKSGLGAMILTNASSYTGKTYINNGILRINNSDYLGATPAAPSPDHLQLNGGTLQFAGDNTNIAIEPNRGVRVGVAGGRLEVGLANSSVLTVDINSPITALGVLELAVRADLTAQTPTTSTLNLGNSGSTNNYAGGLKTEGGYNGVINIFGNNSIGGLQLEGGTVVLTGNNNFTGQPIRMTGGTLTLSGNNTYNNLANFPDAITLTSSTLNLKSNNALGSGGLRLILNDGAEVRLNGTQQTIRTVAGSALGIISNDVLPGNVATSTTLTFNTEINQTFTGRIVDNPFARISLVKKGPASLRLTGANGFVGAVRIEEGVLDVTSVSFANQNSALGSAFSYEPERLILDGGGLSFSSAGQAYTDHSFTLGAGGNAGALIANGVNQTARVIMGVEYIDIANPDFSYVSPPVAFLNAGPRTLTLGGPNLGDNEFNLELGDRAALTEQTSLLKIGTGTWLLGKPSSYTGLTTVQDGVLTVTTNNSLGTSAISTVANVTTQRFTGNLANGTKVSFVNFINYVLVSGQKVYAPSVPTGLNPNQTYYVINTDMAGSAPGTSFQLSALPDSETAVEFFSAGVNVKIVPIVPYMASSSADINTDRFTGNLPNGSAIMFNTRQFLGGAAGSTNTNGTLPGGINFTTVYYVIQSTGKNFQISLTSGGTTAVDITDAGGSGTSVNGNDFYYTMLNPITNNASGVNLTGGRLDLRNVDYLTPETLFLEGGTFLVPANTQSTWAGDMQVNVNTNFTINAGATLTVDGNWLGNRALGQLGEGTLIMRGEMLAPTFVAPSGADNNRRSYTLQAGTLVLDYSLNNNSKLVDNASLTMGGGRRGGVLRLRNGSHEEIVNNLSLQAGNNQIFRDSGESVIRLNTISRAVGSALYFDLARIAKVDNPNVNNILGAWAVIRDASIQSYWTIPGSVTANFTVNTASDSLVTGSDTSDPHGLGIGTMVQLTSTGVLPAGLSANASYYVVSPAATTLKLSPTYNGPPIDISGLGSGVHTLTSVSAVDTVVTNVNVSTDTLTTAAPHLLSSGNVVQLSTTGIAPAGLAAGPSYYVISAGTTTFKLSSKINGTPLDITSVGTGTLSVTTFSTAGQRRVGSSSLTFAADINFVAGEGSNQRIKVAIQYVGGTGPITSSKSGAGTIESPFVYTIFTTNDASSTEAIVNFVSGDPNALDRLTASRSTPPSNLPDPNNYGAPTYLAGGTNDSGSQELDWARNGSATSADGFVVANGIYQTNSMAPNANTNIVSSFSRPGGVAAYTLRFASPTASILTLGGGSNPTVIQTGGILVSPTVGINDSSILGLGRLTTENQGNLQNFLIHQYNADGDLIIGTPIVDRSSYVRRARLSNGNRKLLLSLSATADIQVGWKVTGPGIATTGLDTFVERIVDSHTIELTRETASGGGERNLMSFLNGAVLQFQRLASMSSTDRRRIHSVVTKPTTGVGVFSTSDIYIGMPISGQGIPAGALVASIANDSDITINVDHFFSGVVTDVTFTPSTGIEKLGPGTLVLSGASTYTGVTFIAEGALRVQTLTDGGVAGSLGSSTNAAANLVFNGGTLQYTGENSSTNRAFTLTDFAAINIGHERTVATFSGAISGADRLEKSGSGTLVMTGASGLSDITAREGILRFQTVDTNPAPNAFSPTNFSGTAIANGLTALHLAGGAFELRGTPEGNVSGAGQTFGNTLFVESGGSEVRVTSVLGYDPNNLFSGPQPRSTTLTLMGAEEITNINRNVGGTVRFIENPEAGAGAANIVILTSIYERDKILPWAAYRDTSNLNDVDVNSFAAISLTVGAVASADSLFLHDIGPDFMDPKKWETLGNGFNLDPSESAALAINGSLSDSLNPSRTVWEVNTLRYLANKASTISIPATSTLRIASGGIMVGYDVKGGQKEITGAGFITGGALANDGRDLIIHNYNKASTFQIGANIIDDRARAENLGTVVAGVRDLNLGAMAGPVLQKLRAGMRVSGPGIPEGTIIVNVLKDFGRIILSNEATDTFIDATYDFTDVTSFVQTGTGTTALSGSSTYTGNTYIQGGVLRLNSANAIPGGIGATGGTSALLVSGGGVIGLGTGNFERELGKGLDQVQFTGSGGFAAYGADRTVNLGGEPIPTRLRYGNQEFIPDGSTLVLGATDATHKVTLLNPIELGSFSQVIRTENGPVAVEGQLGGILTGGGRLIKMGTGALRLGVSNANTGGFEIAEGRLIAANVANVFGSSSGLVRMGTSLTNTTRGAAITLQIEGGNIFNNLQVGNVNAPLNTHIQAGNWQDGSSPDPLNVGADLGQFSSMEIVNGYPAIAYYDATDSTTLDLKYVRANDERGLTWGTPVVLATRNTVGKYPSLKVINGNPAVSFYDETNQTLMFVRATDPSGVFWSTPIIADSNPVSSVAVQELNGESYTIVGGTFAQMDGLPRTRLARLNANGSVDTTFNLISVNGEVRAIAVEANGKIIIAGAFTSITDPTIVNAQQVPIVQTRNRIARLNSDGTLDQTYNPNANGDIRALVLEGTVAGTQTLLVGGSFTNIGAANRSRLARLTSSGAADTFNPGPNGEVRCITIQPAALPADVKVIFGGAFTQVGGIARNRIARVTSQGTGALDTTFDPNANNEVRGIALLPDGSMLVGGIFGGFTQIIPPATGAVFITRNRLAKLTSTGLVDLSFELEINNEVRSMVPQADGKVLVLGIFSTIGTTTRNFVARFNADATLDTTFNVNPNYEARSVVQRADGKLVFGGIFSRINGATQQWVARTELSGAHDTTFIRNADDFGRFSSLTFVNGVPAIAYRDHKKNTLRYFRATDANGTVWDGSPVVVDATGNAGNGISMAVTNIGGPLIVKNFAQNVASVSTGLALLGTPAISYYDGDSKVLKYVVANDTNGTDWGLPVTVPDARDVGSRTQLAVITTVGGLRYPAIAYYDSSKGNLMYVRATNEGGVTNNLPDPNGGGVITKPISELVFFPAWRAPQVLDGDGDTLEGQLAGRANADVGQELSLALINGQPTTARGTLAVTYYDATNRDLKIVRAKESEGANWNVPVTLRSEGDIGLQSNLIMTGSVASVSYYDVANGDLKFMSISDAGGYSRLVFDNNTQWQGNIQLDGSLFVAPASGKTATLSGMISGIGGLRMISGGTLNLTFSENSFGTKLSGSGAAVDSGVIIRSGTVTVGDNGALGSTAVELGDVVPQVITVDRATQFGTLIASNGGFDASHNGLVQNAGGPGAFVAISNVLDDRTYLVADVGKLILVKDESSNPERNGIYRIYSVNATAKTMNLVRAAPLDAIAGFKYGTQVRVQSGSSQGKAFFLSGVVTELNLSPVLWMEDIINPDVSLLASLDGLDIVNAIDVNAAHILNNGTYSVGAISSITSGSLSFSGPITLYTTPSASQSQTLTLTSHTTTGKGVIFKGLISEANGGTLGLLKTGPGVVTLEGANTYQGTTTINQGTLLVMNTTGSGTGSGMVRVNAGGVLGGTGTIGGNVLALGAAGNKAIVRPGDPGTVTDAEQLTINQTLTLARESVLEFNIGVDTFTRLAAQTIVVSNMSARFEVRVDPSFIPNGQSFDILDGILSNSAASGAALNWADYLILPSTINWDTSQFATNGRIIAVGVRGPSLISLQPVSQAKQVGESVVFEVAPVGVGSYTYVWRKNGTPISPAQTGTTLTLTNLTKEKDEGNYTVLVSDGITSEVSLAAALTIDNPPRITSHPTNKTASPGTSVSFTVTASATEELPITSYQWYKGSTLLDGRTSQTLTLTDITEADQGTYYVEVRNSAGPTSSNSATLSVNDPVAITADPESVTVGYNFPTTFRVVVSGTGPITYQWQRKPAAVSDYTDIALARSATYTTPALTAADDKYFYRVIVRNEFSTATSAAAQVTMIDARPGISEDGQPDARALLVGETLSLRVLAGGTSTLTYQWKRNGSLLADGPTVQGAKTANLTVTNITVAQAGVYTCVVSNVDNPATPANEALQSSSSSMAGLVTVVGNTLVRTPAQNGTALTLTASVGLPTLPPGATVSYRWLKDGSPVLPDADTPTRITFNGKILKFTKVEVSTESEAGDSGEYSLEVTAPDGPVTVLTTPITGTDGTVTNKDTSVVVGTATVEGNVADVLVYSGAPQLNDLVFDEGIVGGTYSYTIPYLGGDSSAPATFSASPLPAGLKIDAKTGVISGKPTKATVAGGMKVTVKITNKFQPPSQGFAYLTVKALPDNLAGIYAGPLPRHIDASNNPALNDKPGLNGNLGGRFDVTVAATGAFTGKLTMGKVATAFKGVLEVSVTDTALPQGVVVIPRKGLSSLTLRFYIDSIKQKLAVDDGQAPLSSLTDGTDTIYFNGWRNKWTTVLQPATAYQGYYTVALDLATPADRSKPTIPQGVSYASLTVTAKGGAVKVAGKLADGQTITGSQFVGPDGEVLMYQYTAAPVGSLLGTLLIDDMDTPAATDNILDPAWTLSWARPRDNSTKNYSYKIGFDPVALTPIGGIYIAPDLTTTHILDVTGTLNNAEVVFTEASVSAAAIDPALNVNIDTTKKDAVTVVKADPKADPDPNPAKLTIKVTAKTGLFSGTFTLVDADPRSPLPATPTKPRPVVTRKVTFQGIIVDDGTGPEGLGYFLLSNLPSDATETTPELTPATAPILSGRVDFTAVPVVP